MLGLAHMCVIQTVHFWGGFQFSPILVFGFWWEILIHRHRRQEVLLSHWDIGILGGIQPL